MEANIDGRSRTGRHGRVSTVFEGGIDHLGRQILKSVDECVHHDASVQNGSRGVTGFVDGTLEGDWDGGLRGKVGLRRYGGDGVRRSGDGHGCCSGRDGVRFSGTVIDDRTGRI